MDGTGKSTAEGNAREKRIADLQQLLQDMTWTSLRVQEKLLSAYGLTNFQALVLRALASQDTPPDMAFLAEMTVLPPSTMTSVVDRLERDGLAKRASHARDRRKVLVSLTEKGKATLEQLDAQELSFTVNLLQDVDDESISAVIASLIRMNERLKRVDSEWPSGSDGGR